jgi:hypothetical protein
MQSKVKARQNAPSSRGACRLKRQCCTGGLQDLRLLLESAAMGTVSPGKLGYASSIPPTSCGSVALDGQIGAIIFCGPQRVQVSKTLLYVISPSVSISDVGLIPCHIRAVVLHHQDS